LFWIGLVAFFVGLSLVPNFVFATVGGAILLVWGLRLMLSRSDDSGSKDAPAPATAAQNSIDDVLASMRTRTCPHCAETVLSAAWVCRFCSGHLVPWLIADMATDKPEWVLGVLSARPPNPSIAAFTRLVEALIEARNRHHDPHAAEIVSAELRIRQYADRLSDDIEEPAKPADQLGADGLGDDAIPPLALCKSQKCPRKGEPLKPTVAECPHCKGEVRRYAATEAAEAQEDRRILLRERQRVLLPSGPPDAR